jgi:hypothetical protein
MICGGTNTCGSGRDDSDPSALVDFHGFGLRVPESGVDYEQSSRDEGGYELVFLFFSSLCAIILGFLFFGWGWGWWSGLYNYPNGPRTWLADASCIVGAILWMAGIAGLIVWSMQF